MASDRILVRVDAKELPQPAQAVLDSVVPRPTGTRFLPRRTHATWIPAAWLIGLIAVGAVALRATVAAGLDAQAGDDRLVYGAVTAACLVGAVFAAGKVMQALLEMRAVRRGEYRRGLHVLGSEGLLIAGRDTHTWVPRSHLPAPIDLSGPRSGSGHAPSFAFIIVDEHERMERLDCGIVTMHALRRWCEQGHMPEGAGWQ